METQARTSCGDARLAATLTALLAEISEKVHARQDAAANEQVRAAAVAGLVESMTFTTSRKTAAQASASTPSDLAAADRAQNDGWTDEGGYKR